MLPTLVTSFMLLALTITGSLSNSHAASVSVGLAGQGSQSGVPLSATIDIDVVDSMANFFLSRSPTPRQRPHQQRQTHNHSKERINNN